MGMPNITPEKETQDTCVSVLNGRLIEICSNFVHFIFVKYTFPLYIITGEYQFHA